MKRWLDLEDLVPLTRQAPFLAIGMLLGSLTLLGVPPFSGFLGRWMVYLEISRHSTLLLVLIVGSSVLSLFSFAPVFRRLLSGLGRAADYAPSNAKNWAAVPWSEPAYFRALLLILALLPLITGVYPLPILDVIASALNGFRIE